MTAVAPKVAVGDELAFDEGTTCVIWRIFEVNKITPTGRIKCGGGYELNADLTVRGAGIWHGPFEAFPVTDKIRNEIKDRDFRGGALHKLDYVRAKNLTTDQLRRLVAIIEE